MSERSRLAVVIPCYNHGHYIEGAIRSVLDQTRRVDRLIVVDDGSKDDSVAVVRSIKDERIELYTQENQNAFNALNRAVGLAVGDCDFIAILNSDDHYHLERFERLLPQLEEAGDKAVICSGIRVIDEEDNPLPEGHKRLQWFDSVWSLYGGYAEGRLDAAEWMGFANFTATTSNVLARADYFAANPFKPYHFNHDYYFLSVAALRGKLMVDPGPLVNYRVHATNTITSRPAPLMRELLRQHLDMLRDLADELAGDGNMRRRLKLYLHAADDSVSSLQTSLLYPLLGKGLQRWSAEELLELVGSLEEKTYPELEHFPNRHWVTHFKGGGPLGEASTLAEKMDGLREENRKLKGKVKKLKEEVGDLRKWKENRWSKWGRRLGFK